MSKIIIHGRGVVSGCAEGEALVTSQQLSGFGGLDRHTGTVIDKRHELCGQSIAGKILVFPGAKGSSSFSVYFHYCRTNGVAPKGILFNIMTSKMAMGALVTHAPAMTDFDVDPITVIRTGDLVKMDADAGIVEIIRKD